MTGRWLWTSRPPIGVMIDGSGDWCQSHSAPSSGRPLSGPTRSILPAARSLSMWYRMVDSVLARAAAISRRPAEGFEERSERIWSAIGAVSGGVSPDVSDFLSCLGCQPTVSGCFLAVFSWIGLFSGGFLAVRWVVSLGYLSC